MLTQIALLGGRDLFASVLESQLLAQQNARFMDIVHSRLEPPSIREKSCAASAGTAALTRGRLHAASSKQVSTHQGLL